MFKKASFKLVFDILFYIAVLNGISTLLFFSLGGFSPDFSNSIYETKTPFLKHNYWPVVTELAYNIVFLILAYQLRKLAQLFLVNREFKSNAVCKRLYYSGWSLIALSLSLILKKVFLSYYFEITNHFLETKSGLYFLILVLGLSFIRLSKILRLSIQAKQDQDLTI